MSAYPSLLDQLSTSQTGSEFYAKTGETNEKALHDIQADIEQASFFRTLSCENGAPFIFFVDGGGIARVVLGCCNSWTCRRCGHIRALHEYGRMVNGARELAKMDRRLYFLTLTCRGREMSLEEADAGYLVWTNRLLTNLRKSQKKAGGAWVYASVTERQKRGHPHSHFIITLEVPDGKPYRKGDWLPSEIQANHDGIYSAWLEQACVSAGLGKMVDYSEINNPVAVAVYASKYMFKHAVSTEWPKGWRRIRYSNSWPKLPERKSALAFPLVHFSDWVKMQLLGYSVHAENQQVMEAAQARSITCVKLTCQ